ncbi:MAG TPA: hypothetical protein VMD77_04250, partial [Candidatus Baltobacteraceae bacterium]|nr:hypothetical protein [Candidatus Baltobacteraceae bacterium]
PGARREGIWAPCVHHVDRDSVTNRPALVARSTISATASIPSYIEWHVASASFSRENTLRLGRHACDARGQTTFSAPFIGTQSTAS